ncbi:MAG: hypothetical protein KF767_04850 [Bdellovibrionaceae bacterium]|nr:hypothetical protein [Pseudobdellovibrionaceae bacterium]
MDDIRLTRNVLGPWTGLLALTLPLMACTPKTNLEISAESLAPQGQPSKRDMNAFPLNKTVCDPWSGGAPDTSQNGVRARLAHRSSGQPAWTRSSDYLDHGSASGRSLFFSDLNVPTRLFHQGFATETSSVVTDDQGEKLIEYFGMGFSSQIRLASEDPAGDYEFALLSDDGTTMHIGTDGQRKVLIDNEGDHPTRMGCANDRVSLQHGQGLDMDITYFQGPRMHIAMMLMWRKVDAATRTEPLCGTSGNDAFFNPDDNSKPNSNYKKLLSRGWAPVPARNYFLPGQAVFNPCVSGEELTITGGAIVEVSSFQAEIQWRTSRPATSQALVHRLSTGDQYLTDSDQMLRSAHQLRIEGLESGEDYDIQPVSVAEDGAKALGEKIRISTP